MHVKEKIVELIVDIDEDVCEEYWRIIRKRPDKVAQKSFRSEGKYRR